MFFYKVIHRYELNGHYESKEIGIFSSKNKANEAVDMVKDQPGFVDYQDGFVVERCIRLFRPRLLDNIYWTDGFDINYFHRQSSELCCDEEKTLMQFFTFLLTKYNFKFDKLNLGNLVDENGKFWFYGPFNCYYFYNDKVCINFMNLVQKADWYIYVTHEVHSDQNLIKKGKEVPGNLCYNWRLLALVIKEELEKTDSIFGYKIN